MLLKHAFEILSAIVYLCFASLLVVFGMTGLHINHGVYIQETQGGQRNAWVYPPSTKIMREKSCYSDAS